ncbi:hypothetical protein JCM9279_006876 [Rhodotorula babjevae]
MAAVLAVTGSENSTIASHWVREPLIDAGVDDFAVGGFAALAEAAQGAIDHERDVEMIARHLVHITLPTDVSPILVRVHAADRDRVMHRLDHRRPEQRLVDDPALHQPFGTYLYPLRTPQVVGDQLVAVHVKVLVVPDAVDPDPLGDGWLGSMGIIVEQLALAASVAPDSNGHRTAFMIIRWAFLLGIMVFRSNVRRAATPIPEDQHDDFIDRQLTLSLKIAVTNELVGRHGLEVIDACLPHLTAAHARSASEWEIDHYGGQYHRIDPITREGRLLQTIGQYVEIMSTLKALLERAELAHHAHHSLAKSVYHPERRTGPSSRTLLL